MKERNRQIMVVLVVAYFVGFSLLGVGYYLGTTQVTNNFYQEKNDSYIDLYPLTKNPTCQGCYLSNEVIYNTSEQVAYNVHLDNLILNHSYLLMLPEEVILFTYFYEEVRFGLFSLTYIFGEVNNITIRLYEVFTNPFIYRLSEIGDINDLVLLDIMVIDFEKIF
jgi:hypothetical protein